MSTVGEVLKGRPGAWCLDCLVRHTQDRATSVIRDLDALAARVVEGRCGTCSEVGPVFFAQRR
jgi:Zn-finger protein